MMKTFIKDNRGQVLYAVLVAVMFLAVLSMIAMGLTLQHYHAAAVKQQHVTDYYQADAAAELIRIGKDLDEVKAAWDVEITQPNASEGIAYYTITCRTVTIRTVIEAGQFKSWEVSYHAKAEQTE